MSKDAIKEELNPDRKQLYLLTDGALMLPTI